MIINIGRQLASGGKTIGSIMAKHFDMSYYDKDLLSIAANESGLKTDVFERIDEQANKGFVGSFMNFAGIGSLASFTSVGYNNGLTNEELFRIQSEVIQKLASEHDSVFIGRCADYVLRSRTDCLNIFFCADLQARIDRIRRNHSEISEKEAISIIEHNDKIRSEYYNFYTNKKWGMSTSYHLCINTSVLGVEQTAQQVIEFINLYKTKL